MAAIRSALPWGTDAFEANVPKDYPFPPAWADAKKRKEGREILNDQFQLLGEAEAARHQLLGNGYGVDEIEVEHAMTRD